MSTDSSTTPSPFQYSGTGQGGGGDSLPPLTPNHETWYKKPEAVISIMGMALAGVIGWGSSYLLLKEVINSNKTDISVLNEKATNFNTQISELKEDVEKIPDLDREIAVLKEKVSNNKEGIKANLNSNKNNQHIPGQ